MSRAAGLVPVRLIDAHHTNVRTDLGDLRELAASIDRNGILVPLVLERRGERFRIRDGHRRWAAAQILCLPRVPAIVHTTSLEERDWLLQAVEINEHRRQLDDSERRAGVLKLRAAGWAWPAIASAFGVTTATVRRWSNQPLPLRQQPLRRPPARRVAVAALQQVIDDWRASSGDLAALLAALETLVQGVEQA